MRSYQLRFYEGDNWSVQATYLEDPTTRGQVSFWNRANQFGFSKDPAIVARIERYRQAVSRQQPIPFPN